MVICDSSAETPGEPSGRVALASAASRRPAARAGAQASAVARIGESLARIAEIPGKACERVGPAPAAPRRPVARADAQASAAARIGESLGSRLNQVHHRTMVAMATAAAKLAASLS